MKLFKIELSGRFENIPSVWVLATDPTEAERIVKTALDDADYGFSKDRTVIKIELIAEDKLYCECGVLFQKNHAVIGLNKR